MPGPPQDRAGILAAAGLPIDDATAWAEAVPVGITGFLSDCHEYSEFWLESARLIERLPPAVRRNGPEQAAAAVILETSRAARARFLLITSRPSTIS